MGDPFDFCGVGLVWSKFFFFKPNPHIFFINIRSKFYKYHLKIFMYKILPPTLSLINWSIFSSKSVPSQTGIMVRNQMYRMEYPFLMEVPVPSSYPPPPSHKSLIGLHPSNNHSYPVAPVCTSVTSWLPYLSHANLTWNTLQAEDGPIDQTELLLWVEGERGALPYLKMVGYFCSIDPRFWHFTITLGPFLWQTRYYWPSLSAEKNRFVSITFSFRDNLT